jgi:zinc transport system substrate-binding protein
MQRRGLRIPTLGLGLILFGAPVAEAAPKVVASIAPLAGIAAAVLGEGATPTLLLPASQSPHHGALRPSQARALADADVVLWIGPELETGLDSALDAMPESWVGTHALSAMLLPKVVRKPFRHLETLDPEPAAHGAHDTHGGGDAHQHHGDIDPHLWLDPANAAAIANALAERLALLEPERASVYRANAQRFGDAMTALKADLDTRLAPVRGRNFVVFHDAYQYFEQPFGLAAVAALTLDPAQPMGGRHLVGVREKARALKAACVFADAQAPQDAVAGIARDLGLKAGSLDPLGRDIDPSANSYVALLKRLADSYRACLE